MIKKLLFIAFIALANQTINAQSFLLKYAFTSVTPGSGTVDPTPAPTATGVLSGSFTANGLYANPTTSNVFAFQGWPAGSTPSSNVTFTGSLDPAKYFEIILNPAPNYVITLTNMSFLMNRSSTAPRHWAVRTNKDGYANNVPATAMGQGNGTVITVEGGDTFFWSDYAVTSSNITNNLCLVNFSGGNFTDQYPPYHLRLHAWDGTSAAGSWRIDSVMINGSSTFSLDAGLPSLTHDVNAQFKLYPNPSDDGFVTIEPLKNNFLKVEVINSLGSIIASQNNTFEEKLKLDLTNIPHGTYFIKITSNNKITNEKLIISK